MAIDLLCGQCEGHLLAEEPGSVVACPHCGAHLQVPGSPAEEPSPDSSPPLMEMADSPVETADHAVDASSATISDASPAGTMTEIALTDESMPEGPAESTPLSELPSHSTPRLPITPAKPVLNLQPLTANSTPEAAVMTAPVLASSVPHAEPVSLPSVEDSGPSAVATVPRFWFFLVASYASAVTLAFLFLLLMFSNIRSHQLESLPDVVPKIQNGEVGLEVAPPEANVARGHMLPLGETRRFGSLKVTPLRVTQGSLRFEHALNDPTADRPASGSVLKLWLRFENVSWNQTFAPLDPLLLFKRHYQDFGKSALTNQFLCRVSERKSKGDLHNLFEISVNSEFRIAEQNLNTVLAPGDSVEIFIPSEERIDDLTGDLVWRVQFRKGYHPRTRHGVTTLIDVPFHRSNVKNET